MLRKIANRKPCLLWVTIPHGQTEDRRCAHIAADVRTGPPDEMCPIARQTDTP